MVLTKRMKVVMGKIIGENQITFLMGRNTFDEVVILNEIIEETRISKSRKL